ncbi:flavin-containing monooxygenase [Aspergillus saccharolyticus JOP 1030-1]|uniref:FAD/NAD(P)-binding domain-containing protein n=1 Tax=Aspergillus saccharolyticus JOP 1030-1 TaxID=1450539 RepID=A0A318ZJB4_9EURO|nr:FAD/NAD(P)-binding domain-containing protein [Aspergillus saccharolyticus JOP 1030-1]PYH44653.1 FAD/NAD(P)-binding domain-containing protein [Aspergillus saccharolyticus JOP 1030-1]
MFTHISTYDIVIIGAGFSGINLLYHLRKLGYSCRIYESGTDLGGTWHWNTYPGCRTWSFREKYPSADESRAYFAHVEKVLDIKKDVDFETSVTGAWYDVNAGGKRKWRVETSTGKPTHCRFLISCVGTGAERYLPDFSGLETFTGDVCHSACWPKDGIQVAGKKVAVIGTGASGVQIVQSWAKEAESLVVFQRTPNLALPMQQETLSPETQKALKEDAPRIFAQREKTLSGLLEQPDPRATFDVTFEEREAFYQALYTIGGFSFLLSSFSDLMVDEKANRAAYDFWAKRTRARITDPRKRDLLAPLEPPHPIGSKRSCYEQDYFEMLDRPNVELVNLREPGRAIAAIKPDGIETADGTFYRVDVIALATGFNSVTGSLTRISGLRNTSGTTLADEWKIDGASSYLGMTRKGYPNMFLCYAVHGPTFLSNGPASIEIQSRWIVDAIRKMDETGLISVEPTEEAEKNWKTTVNTFTDMTLLGKADSWWVGANIPGKKREMLAFPGGLPLYEDICRQALQNWDGFVTL